MGRRTRVKLASKARKTRKGGMLQEIAAAIIIGTAGGVILATIGSGIARMAGYDVGLEVGFNKPRANVPEEPS
jgi:hypothetical protein